MSDNEVPSQAPSPGGEGKKPWSPTTTQIVATLITVVGTIVAAIAAAVVPGLIPGHGSDPGATTAAGASQPATGSPTPAASSATDPVTTATTSAPSAPARSFPAQPEQVLQDDGGTGVYGVAFTSDTTFATGDSNGSAYLFTVGRVGPTDRLADKSGQTIYGLAYSPKRHLLAANTMNAPDYTTGSLVLWDGATGRYLTTLTNQGTTGVGSPAAFSPDGGTVAASDANGGIYLWSTTSYRSLGVLKDPSDQPNFEIAYDPAKAGYLAAANGNGTAYLWNTQTESVVRRFPDPDGKGAGSIAFSPDGSTIATGDLDGDVRLWDTGSGAPTGRLTGLKGGKVEDIAFDPRAGLIAATVNDANAQTFEFCVWTTAGKLLATRVDPGSTGATKVAFSPDGSLLAVGDTDNHTYVWDVAGLG